MWIEAACSAVGAEIASPTMSTATIATGSSPWSLVLALALPPAPEGCALFIFQMSHGICPMRPEILNDRRGQYQEKAP